MDAKTSRPCFARLSLFCAIFAWAGDRDVFGLVLFFARFSRDARRSL